MKKEPARINEEFDDDHLDSDKFLKNEKKALDEPKISSKWTCKIYAIKNIDMRLHLEDIKFSSWKGSIDCM